MVFWSIAFKRVITNTISSLAFSKLIISEHYKRVILSWLLLKLLCELPPQFQHLNLTYQVFDEWLFMFKTYCMNCCSSVHVELYKSLLSILSKTWKNFLSQLLTYRCKIPFNCVLCFINLHNFQMKTSLTYIKFS